MMWDELVVADPSNTRGLVVIPIAMIFQGVGIFELLVIAMLGFGTLAVLFAVVYFVVKAGQGQK